MGSSAKKKNEKKKDFRKPKLKVGKTKPKASNFTDTSFKSKSIVMGQQSLSTTAPDTIQQFKHSLSLASSKSDKQRREALSYLTSQLSADDPVNPVGTQAILTKLLPLISDSSTPVRSQLIKLLWSLRESEVAQNVEQISMFVRAGMTHLSTDINSDALGVMEWLLEVAGEELVACPGGWVKTLRSFCAMLGWKVSTKKDGWTTGTRQGLKVKNAQVYAKQISTLAKFIVAGLGEEEEEDDTPESRWDSIYKISRDPHAFDYLNLFGQQQDEDGRSYADLEDRRLVFQRRFYDAILAGLEQAKKEGGATGRAVAELVDVLNDCMEDVEASERAGDQDLQDLW